LLVQLFGDVVVGDRAEQAAVNAGLLGQLDGGAGELFALGLGGSQLLGGSLFQFGALGFELSLGSSGGARARPDGIRKLRA
jgi:hypothetical protein